MVLVSADGGLCPLLQDGIEGGVREVYVTIAEGHLVDDIESKRVGQFIEPGLTGIV